MHIIRNWLHRLQVSLSLELAVPKPHIFKKFTEILQIKRKVFWSLHCKILETMCGIFQLAKCHN